LRAERGGGRVEGGGRGRGGGDFLCKTIPAGCQIKWFTSLQMQLHWNTLYKVSGLCYLAKNIIRSQKKKGAGHLHKYSQRRENGDLGAKKIKKLHFFL
jgi:hypothetical protein